MKKFLAFFSYLFHPIVLPVYTAFLYFFFARAYFHSLEMLISLAQIGIMTFFLPITIYFFMKSMRLLESKIMLERVRDRLVPMLVYISLLLLLKDYVLQHNRTYEYQSYIWATAYTYIALLIGVLFKKKFSVHVALLSGSVTFFILLSLRFFATDIIFLILLILIWGITASSRLYFKAHNSTEVVIGCVLGVLPQLLFWKLSFS